MKKSLPLLLLGMLLGMLLMSLAGMVGTEMYNSRSAQLERCKAEFRTEIGKLDDKAKESIQGAAEVNGFKSVDDLIEARCKELINGGTKF